MRYNIIARFNHIERYGNFYQLIFNSKIPKEDVEVKLLNPEESVFDNLMVSIGYNNPDDEMDIIGQIKRYGRVIKYSGTVVFTDKVEEWRVASTVKRDELKKISITVSDDRLRKIEANATRLGISLEELVLRGFEELANQPEAAFEDAMTYVISKNAELYQRLQ